MSGLEAQPEVGTGVRRLLPVYRAVAYVVGTFLIVLVFVAVPLKYFAHQETLVAVIGPMHGFGYMVYLAVAFALSRRSAWSLRGTALVLLAGTVPVLSFVAERVVTRRVTSGRSL